MDPAVQPPLSQQVAGVPGSRLLTIGPEVDLLLQLGYTCLVYLAPQLYDRGRVSRLAGCASSQNQLRVRIAQEEETGYIISLGSARVSLLTLRAVESSNLGSQ